MNAGIDIGYNRTKLAYGDRQTAAFASVVGTPIRERFSLNGRDSGIRLMEAGQEWLIGDEAAAHSLITNRSEARDWINKPDYYRLYLAAISQITTANYLELSIVTGLPVDYMDDAQQLERRLMGRHTVQLVGRHSQTINTTFAKAIPQGLAAALSLALDDKGRLVDQDFTTGWLGVIDMGGGTVNFNSIYKLAEMTNESASIRTGGWQLVRQTRDIIERVAPGADLRDNEVEIIIQQGHLGGLKIPGLDDLITPLADKIITTADNLWKGGHKLNQILVSGGGAHLFGRHIAKRWPRKTIILDNPQYANALGYWKLSQRL